MSREIDPRDCQHGYADAMQEEKDKKAGAYGVGFIDGHNKGKAERDALRELLREARAYVVSDHGWDYENGGWLADRIDAALKEKP